MILKDLSMSFGMQKIFNDVNVIVNDNQKVGIVGVNGAGKTTLFKIIMGILQPDNGKVILKKNTRVEWLPQVIDDNILKSDISVLDFLMSARPIAKIENELNNICIGIENKTESEQKKIIKKIGELQSQLDYWDVYNAENILLKIIDGMNIDYALLEQKLNTLSGGQKSKIAFAKLLYSKPEIILLDEPTNHLDKKSKDYVTEFLKKYQGNVFIISHDIEFLNQVTTHTMFLDKRTQSITLYDGNYNTFKKLHEEREKNIQNQIEIQEKEEARLRDIVLKYSNSSGKRKRMAQSREKTLEKLLANKIKKVKNQKQVNLQMDMERESSNIPLKIKNLSFSYDNKNKMLLNNLSFELNKGEKFLIVGENGIGKSTLLKLIIGQLKPIIGEIEIGLKTDIGYYAQEHDLLDNNKNILENFNDLNKTEREIRGVLGRFLFHGDDVYKKISVLSPGEKSRIALAKLSLMGSNLLILDEPTNHLDPETQIIIGDVFKTFKGTMLIVSHNQAFVDHVGIERLLILPQGKIVYYDSEIVEYFEEKNAKNNL